MSAGSDWSSPQAISEKLRVVRCSQAELDVMTTGKTQIRCRQREQSRDSINSGVAPSAIEERPSAGEKGEYLDVELGGLFWFVTWPDDTLENHWAIDKMTRNCIIRVSLCYDAVSKNSGAEIRRWIEQLLENVLDPPGLTKKRRFG